MDKKLLLDERQEACFEALEMVESIASSSDSERLLAGTLPKTLPLNPFGPDCEHFCTYVMIGDDWLTAVANEDDFAPWNTEGISDSTLLKQVIVIVMLSYSAVVVFHSTVCVVTK